jgi:AcrR family transcriptional regulator
LPDGGHDEEVREDEPHDDGHKAFLEAGIRLLAAASRDELNRLVSASAVSAEANLSRQTFYRRWANHHDYVEDLIGYLTDPSLSSGSESLADLSEVADELDPDDPVAEIRRLSKQTFGQFTGDPTQMSRMLLWAIHPNDDLVAECLENLYTTNDAAAAEGFLRIGEVWGLEPRPPFTRDTVAVLMNALRDGLILHMGIDPERVPPSFLGDVIVAFTTAVVRRTDDETDSHDVDEVCRRALRRTSPSADGDAQA